MGVSEVRKDVAERYLFLETNFYIK